MAHLKRDFNRFLFKHRDKGIPRLMLWICISNALVFLISLFNESLVNLLYFNAAAILRGQVWRLVTYIFTFAVGSGPIFYRIFVATLSISFYYWIGTLLENTWGTLRFNLFYLMGVVLMDATALGLYLGFGIPAGVTTHYLNLSMFLAVATLLPDYKIYLNLIIPVKMKWLAWLDLGLTLYEVVSTIVLLGPYYNYHIGIILYALFPLIALLNYFIFFGRDVKNLLPGRRLYRKKPGRVPRQKNVAESQPSPDWAKNYRSDSGQRPYRHKCTVCGRTDVDCPDLEFRYCSKCAGYFCYCIDHINNHTHIQ